MLPEGAAEPAVGIEAVGDQYRIGIEVKLLPHAGNEPRTRSRIREMDLQAEGRPARLIALRDLVYLPAHFRDTPHTPIFEVVESSVG